MKVAVATARMLAVPTVISATAQERGIPMASLKVDHASVCGAALAPMQRAFAEIGLEPDYGGPHANGVTHMALLGFHGGSYLELIAPEHEGKAEGSEWSKFMTGDPRACAWAVGVEGIATEVTRLKNAGIPASGPFPGSRKKPDGTVLKWETARAGMGTPGATLPFMIEDQTPRNRRVQPSASVRGSGLLGVSVVVLAVNDLDAAIALFQRAYGWPAPAVEEHPEFTARLAHFAGTPVMLATPLGAKAWLQQRLSQFGDSPAAFLLGTQNFSSATRKFGLVQETLWFGEKVAWFNSGNLHEVRLGVIGP